MLMILQIPLLVHFHPSVSMFASSLVNDQKMPPKPDLASHTLTHFLDRFVYRNAKAAAGGPRGSSIMQPLPGGDSRDVLLSNWSMPIGQEPVNSEAFWRKKMEDVPIDEVFFHKYFSQIGKAKEASSKKKTSSKSISRSDDEDGENEDEIWRALVDSRPEVEGNVDDDSDLEMLDLDDSDGEYSLGEAKIEGEYTGGAESDEFEGPSLEAFEEDAELGNEIEVSAVVDELFAKELQIGERPESSENRESNRQKKRLKNLPTFASVEDYAEMLDEDEDENEDV